MISLLIFKLNNSTNWTPTAKISTWTRTRTRWQQCKRERCMWTGTLHVDPFKNFKIQTFQFLESYNSFPADAFKVFQTGPGHPRISGQYPVTGFQSANLAVLTPSEGGLPHKAIISWWSSNANRQLSKKFLKTYISSFFNETTASI